MDGENSASGAPKSAAEVAEAEACRMREAVKASYRPRVSQVYGVHVPLGERAARLQCLAMLSLVAGGEDNAGAGGGSGSGGEILFIRHMVLIRVVFGGGVVPGLCVGCCYVIAVVSFQDFYRLLRQDFCGLICRICVGCCCMIAMMSFQDLCWVLLYDCCGVVPGFFSGVAVGLLVL